VFRPFLLLRRDQTRILFNHYFESTKPKLKMSGSSRSSYCLLFLLFVFINLPLQSRSQVLPQPSGKFSIGFQRLEWTDSTRTASLASDTTIRKIVADVWYPSEKPIGEPIPYLDTLAIKGAFREKELQSFIGKDAADRLTSGAILTHAYKSVMFNQQLQSAPVIIFSHGMSMVPQLYSTQIEDLVSHGYVLVALSHPHDAWLVSFTDGTQIPFETKERNAAGETEVQHIAYENKRIEVWAADIRFAIDQLKIINTIKTDSIRFAGHLDLSRVGALGHSAGGRAAARACQLDDRIKSCADLDGVAMMQPFYLRSDGVGMKQPFLMFERVRNIAPDESDAASMGMTLPELTTLVNRLRHDKKTALAATGGSYHVLLNFDNSSHMSFSDLPLLQAKNEAACVIVRQVLQVTCRYTREFFNKTLRQMCSTLYDGNKKLNYIDQVQNYPKTRVKK